MGFVELLTVDIISMDRKNKKLRIVEMRFRVV